MSNNSSTLNWKGIIMGVLFGLLIAWLLNITFQFVVGFVLGFQLRGTPPQEMLVAALMSWPVVLTGMGLAFLGGLVGGRRGARDSEGSELVAGLIVGIIVAAVVMFWRWFSGWGADLWFLIDGVAAVVGGAVGGWLIQRRGHGQLHPAV
jgi:hypothetical protein